MLLFSCKNEDEKGDEPKENLSISYVYIGDQELIVADANEAITLDELIEIRFAKSVNTSLVKENVQLLNSDNQQINLTFEFFNDNKLIKADHPTLDENTSYNLIIKSGLEGAEGEVFEEVSYPFKTLIMPLVIESIIIEGEQVNPGLLNKEVSLNPEISLHFNTPVDVSDVNDYSSFTSSQSTESYTLKQTAENVISFETNAELEGYIKYNFKISSDIEKRIGKPFDGLDLNFITILDSTYKFPEISDEELLTLVQKQTFKYFWDFAHPVSGLSRERNTSGSTVASGASGFGLMTIPVGIERGFISRAQGVERLSTMINFLGDKAERFHGAWSHWLHGETGAAKPFSQKDDGGDLVETSFVAMGLMTVRQYLDENNSNEKAIIDKINDILDEIEWDWYRQDGQNGLYWHWSPNYGWEKNHKIRGWNEALITYFMAATSSSHGIPKEVYDGGWKAGKFINGQQFYDISLPLGPDYGGPLFFEQYTFLGLDPRNLTGDEGESYWEQVVNHSLINREHCIRNPKGYVGYSKDCWGLTASDGYTGYSAHSPTNDRGVITPTAALSSFPFTPDESMEALKHFYYRLGDRLWGPYGFYDAFSIQDEWYATSNIGIDQGPIILMIENYRTQLLWNLFMSAPEVEQAMNTLGFSIN